MKSSIPVHIFKTYLDCSTVAASILTESIFNEKWHTSRSYRRSCCYGLSSRENDPRLRTNEERDKFKKCMNLIGPQKEKKE